MVRKSFGNEQLAKVRAMPLSQVLNRLQDDGSLFWRRDFDFVPERERQTVRLFLSSPSGSRGKFWSRALSGMTSEQEGWRWRY